MGNEFETVARAAIEALFNGLCLGILLTVFVACLLRVLPRMNASTRYAIWWATLAAVLALPLARITPAPTRRIPAADVAAAIQAVPAEPAPAPEPVAEIQAPPPAEIPKAPIQLRSGPWLVAALAAWLLLALRGCARVLWSCVSLQVLKRHAVSAEPERQRRLEHWLELCDVRRRVRLGYSERVATPIAAGLGKAHILMPRSLAQRLSEAELDQVMLHELAHLRRWDDWANLAQKLIEAVFFYHPAVRWIGRKLTLERELACDDWVLTLAGGQAAGRRTYAFCLTKLIELTTYPEPPAVAPGAALGRKQMFRRIAMLLDKKRNAAPKISRFALWAAAAALALALAAGSHVSSLIAWGQDEERYSGPRTIVRNSGLWGSFSVEMRGRIEFTDDDKDVKSISPGGRLVIEERRGLTFRKITISSGWSGAVERTFSLNGVNRAFDSDAKEWMAAVLPEVIRENAINARERVARILKQRGAAAVLEEIALIRSDHAKRIYFQELFASGTPLDNEILRKALRQIGREVHSDFEKANLLERSGETFAINDTLRSPYFEAVDTVNSDFERKRVLTGLVKKNTGKDNLAQVCRSAAKMNSDFEKANVLVALLDNCTIDETVRSSLFKTAGTIHSDHEHSRVLSAVLKKGAADSELLIQTVRSAALMNSDFEKANVLAAVAGQSSEATVLSAVVQASASMNSAHEHRRVLSAVAKRAGLSKDTLEQMCKSASRLNSDFEKANTLVEIAETHGVSDALAPEFFRAAATVVSANEHQRVLSAVLKRAGASKAVLLEVLKSAAKLNSDFEKANVLSKVAPMVPDDNAVIDAYVQTAETIHSDSEYRRAVTALAKREGMGNKVFRRRATV